ncbi:MAG: ABC transporter ATP-binding protein [Acidimicrobiia bacterium]
MLRVSDLTIQYGRIPAVRDLDLEVAQGEIVGLIGPNGSGKTSTLNAIAGVGGKARGSITFHGAEILGMTPERIVAQGIALVPEGRQIFGTLTVAENLELGLTTRKGDPGVEGDLTGILQRFPILDRYYRHSAGSLSGGEQQQLAIARAILTRPRLLLLDEPSLGLAPQLIDLVFEIIPGLRDEGMTILLVEQNASRTIEISDRIYIMRSGEFVFAGSSAEAASRTEISADYLGISAVGAPDTSSGASN